MKDDQQNDKDRQHGEELRQLHTSLDMKRGRGKMMSRPVLRTSAESV